MVERLHRQLKAALTCHTGSTWLDAIPVVLLGIRSAFKPDIQTTAAELVYGEPLRLPGEFLAPSSTDPAACEPSEFIAQLRQTMASFRPSPAARNGQAPTSVYKDLATCSCSHVMLRDDTVRPPLQPPYTGPFAVTARTDKTITLLIKGQAVTVTIARLNPTYILSDDDDTFAAQPPAPSTARQCCISQRLPPAGRCAKSASRRPIRPNHVALPAFSA